MPQMGESIAEGTIVRWIKKVGDSVDRDEPLFEISTDKVDAEIPSPAAGTLLDISAKEGETVPVNSVVATIGAPGEAGASAPGASSASGDAGASGAASASAASSPATAAEAPRLEADAPVAATPPPSGKTAAPKAQADGSPALSATSQPTPRPTAEAPAMRTSPLVRRIAKDHGVDLNNITGSGLAGRVTKRDILEYLDQAPQASSTRARRDAREAPGAPEVREAPVAPEAREARDAPEAPEAHEAREAPEAHEAREAPEAPEIVPMSIMRKRIAEHMIVSRRTSAHVYSVFEVNYGKIDQIRQARRAEYEQRGVKLTYTSFIAKIAIECLRRHKVINASIDGDNIVYKREINLGIAVALDNGLIVPVIKRADELNLLGLSRAIADVAERARNKKLNPEEVHGGTFTITNPGAFGAQFGLPIINQPQVAILGVGTIEKRAVVIDDMIGIRLMGYLTLGYDHRLVDGAVADQFMADVKKGLENFDASQA
jgi:pyruvate dehydrogenase E2 component (dihydrolipoyllysine-residue acetyltransferase)